MQNSPYPSEPVERRSKPRIPCSYPAMVSGRYDGGRRFQAKATLTNMSVNGMYLRLKDLVPRGETISINVRLSTNPIHQGKWRFTANGTIVRTEILPDGAYGIGIKLYYHRFR